MSNWIGAHTTTVTGKWMIAHEALLGILSEAARRATRQQRAILASFTHLIEWNEPVRAFTGARLAELGECFYWERPVEQYALVGVGAAATIETYGCACFIGAASAWRTLLHDAVITNTDPAVSVPGAGPLLFGGFRFDPLSLRTQLWADFPDGLLILPRALLSYHANRLALTVNRMIHVSDDIEQCAREIEASIGQLQVALERVPTIPQEVAFSELSVHELQPASEWLEMVARMVDKIRLGAFEKIVLAREVQAELHNGSGAFAISTILQRLRESYPTAYVFAVQRGERFFMGATPERLVQAQDGQVRTMALAGSARRGETAQEDASIGLELLKSEKNNSEHAIVVAMVREALKNHCTRVQVSGAPQLLKLKNVQHLETPITGELIAGRCILDVLADLHPTPAVGGFPRDAALAAIRSAEKLDRGWYAGPLGWIDPGGHGEFAVALRSGLIDGTQARLFAGCGIVADSDPQTEFAESCLKFQAMLRALGGEN